MAVRHGYGKIAGADALVFAYDTGDARNSYKGEPTVNYIPSSFAYNIYAYASGPVDTTVLNENNKSITAKRYTITNAVNTARAAIRPSGLTTGVAYTFSFKWKYNGTTTTSPSIEISAFKGNPEGGANNNGFTSQTGDTVSIGNGWYLTTYTFVFSSNPTGASILTFGISTGSNTSYLGETFDIYEAQFEIKDHRTPFVNGTRSSTQGLLDLTGNKTIDLSSTGFDSNAQPEFDGTNDHMDVGTGIISGTGDFTVEAVIQSGYQEVNGTILANYPAGNFQTFFSGRYIGLYLANSSAYLGSSPFTTVLPEFTTDPIHFLALREGTETRVYLNGVLKKTGSSSSTIGTTSTPFRVGANTNGTEDFLGQIFVVKAYSRALTADEVRNNYNQYRTRFNI